MILIRSKDMTTPIVMLVPEGDEGLRRPVLSWSRENGS